MISLKATNTETTLFKAEKLAASGLSNSQIANIIDIPAQEFAYRTLFADDSLTLAIENGRQSKNKTTENLIKGIETSDEYTLEDAEKIAEIRTAQAEQKLKTELFGI